MVKIDFDDANFDAVSSKCGNFDAVKLI